MGVFQELISRLILDPSGYVAGGNVVKRVSHEAALAIDELVLKGKEGFGRIGETLRLGEVVAPLAAVATGVGLLELGKHAYEVSETFDKLERHIIGVTHSAERAKQIMAFGEKQSGLFGMATPEELDAVAAQLETLKLRTEDYLPVLEKLAAISPDGASSMKGLAEAFALIEQGQGGRAIRELERLGITIQTLEKHGLRFTGVDEATGQRTLVTPPKQALAGISAAVDEIGGPALAAFLDSTESKSQRMRNALDEAYRSAGDAVRSALLPAMESVERVVTHMSEDGQVKRITDGFLGLFGLGPGKLDATLQRVANFVEAMPGHIKAVEKAVMDALPVIEQLAAIWAGLWVANKVIGFSNMVVGAYKAIALAAAAADAAETAADVASGVGIGTAIAAGLAGVGAYRALTDMINEATKSTKDLNTQTDKAIFGAERMAAIAKVQEIGKKISAAEEDIEQDQKDIKADKRYGSAFDEQGRKDTAHLEKRKNDLAELKKQLAEAMAAEKKTPEHDPEPPKPGDTTPPVDPVLAPVQQIARHTERMANAMEKAHNLGGGDLGREGAAVYELGQYHEGGARGISDTVHVFGQNLQRQVDALIQRAQRDGIRQRTFGF